MAKSAPLVELRRKMRETLNTLMTDDGLSAGQLVLRLHEEHPEEIAEARDDLANIGLQKVIQELMPKHRATAESTEQFSLPLALKGIVAPDAISVPTPSNEEGTSVKWVPFRRARLEHLNAHLKLLNDSISNDRARARQMKRIVDFFAPHMKRHPKMTVEEVVQAISKARPPRRRAA